MITVKIERKQTNDIVSFTMSGHADSGPYGHDLVCAGVSAVSFGTVNAIVSLCEIVPEVTMDEDGGFLRCELPEYLEQEMHEKVQLLLEAMLISLQSIAEEYRTHLTIQQTTRGGES